MDVCELQLIVLLVSLGSPVDKEKARQSNTVQLAHLLVQFKGKRSTTRPTTATQIGIK